jgi:hypothetical protein
MFRIFLTRKPTPRLRIAPNKQEEIDGVMLGQYEGRLRDLSDNVATAINHNKLAANHPGLIGT